jgi:hypothetical protein
MPKYIYYKIVCKDENIKDCYVGKTKKLIKRVRNHKSSCNNENNKNYNLKLYQYIRENGGINNWNFIEIEKGEYDNEESALKERELIEELNATLNSLIPSRTLQEWKELFNKNYCKKYYKENIEKIKEYRKDNIEYYKLWNYNKYHNNIEKERQRVKDYRDENRESILCECGGKYQLFTKARHFRTKLHQEYLLNEIN